MSKSQLRARYEGNEDEKWEKERCTGQLGEAIEAGRTGDPRR